MTNVASMRVMPTSAAGGAASVAGGGRLFAGRRRGFRYRWFGGTVLRSCRRGLEEVADARLSRTSVVGFNLFIRAARAGHSVAFFSHRFSRELARAKCGERVQELWSQFEWRPSLFDLLDPR